ncbi:ATP-binding cassette domain-containing protein [Dendronalium sp. ChiSLP03b]|uniref:ATP-binding cassette domain-containing protein n=1 Tax=Dendronalium sp. ChiSLP03b TaxID=3075381 RepID=UPI002AD4F814|nr:ATP-binding cassette domain-containing protein [Dendronalium sp. ChiSLP03b]MDZ8205090.1 ATP-binding cassette domain-containing protein [Dendronalium sp. ChiSLP03b]
MNTIASATGGNNLLTHSHNSTEVIQVEGLCKRYGKLVAVKGIDFAVRRGEIFGLIGPDGAGKTTTFHILGGVMEASAGTIQILGKAPRDARLAIGYLTQQFSLYPDLSIDENLRYSAGLREMPEQLFWQRRSQYLRLMDLEKFSDRLAGRLSGGMKQKLALCCALISQPEILLLDEPTTGVDPVSRREFWDILAAVASQGVTVVVATPYLDEAERCDRIALMYEGQIQQIGTLAELRASLGLQRLELRTNQLEVTESALQVATNRKQTSIVDVQTFGDRLDVLVKDPAVAIAAIEEICDRQHLELNSIQIGAATLENVFVNRLRASGNEPEFIPFPRKGTGDKGDKGDKKILNLQYPISITQSIAIGADKLRKVFGNFQAVKNIDLEIRYGEIYGLLGANGAGKTTTIKMLCGLLAPTSGKISLAGQTRNLRSSAVRQRIGYMSQKFTLYDDLTIIQNLEFYCGVYSVPTRLRRRKIDWVLATCGLVGKENLLTGQLPGGWKQRVAFGASVMHEPEILFLDEPTSGVDPLARRQFWRLINEFARSGTAVLVTTHYLEEAEQCNRMGFMVAGEVVAQGSPSEIKAAQPGQLLEIVIDNTQIAANLLKNHLAAWRVSIFGDRLHVVLDRPDGEVPQIQSVLQAADLNIHSLRVIPFSLEDAFIGIVQRAQEGAG